MNHGTLPAMLLLSCMPLACVTAPPAGNEQPANTDVAVIDHQTKLPTDGVRLNDLKRVEDLLKQMPPDHRLRLSFVTLAPGGESVRYVRLATTLDASGRPDGREVEFPDWYQRPVRETEYVAGLKNGTERVYAIGAFIDKRTGRQTQNWFVRTEIPYVMDKVDGIKKTFYADGKLASETSFVKGVAQGEARSFGQDGKPLRVATFVDNRRHGKVIDYWPGTEQVSRVVNYSKGQVHGVSQAFYKNGKLKWERPFRDNQQHGVEKHFDADGKLEKQLYWIKGQAVSAEEFRKRFKP